MEMNFKFFVANGFASGDLFKEAFYDQIFGEIALYIPYLVGIIVGVFITGLIISWLVLKSFSQIERFSDDSMEYPDDDLIFEGLNKKKLINQVSRIFFKYIQIYKQEGRRPHFRLPKKLQDLSYPPVDKVFFLQYSLIVAILCLITSLTLHAFTNELFQQIISNGINVLPSDQNITKFLYSQKEILFNVYTVAIITNISLYMLISKNIIKNVEGVSFGFARDMLRVIDGEHHARLRPRFTDPGQALANSVNDYLEDIFPDDALEYEDEYDGEYEEFEQIEAQDNVNEDTEHEDTEHEDTEHEDNNIIAFESELPPAFIQERMVAGGEKIFHIITPDGLKVENVDSEMLLSIVKETKK
jgi:hypothetical protein